MTPNERELIRRVRKGDEAAFAELMHRNEERLFEAAYQLVDNTEDAQDVVQETFIKAFQTLASFKGDTQFFTWLHQLATEVARHSRRSSGCIPFPKDRRQAEG